MDSEAHTDDTNLSCLTSFEEISEKFNNKEEALDILIGKRKSRLIRIETFDLKKSPVNPPASSTKHNNNNNPKEPMHHMYNNYQYLVNNAMTMQKALETAYNDWNKEKLNQVEPVNVEIRAQEAKMLNNTFQSNDQVLTVPAQNNVQSQSCLTIETNFDQYNYNHMMDTTELETFNETKPNDPVDNSTKTSTFNVKSRNNKEIPNYYEIPVVDLVKGFIHIYKDG